MLEITIYVFDCYCYQKLFLFISFIYAYWINQINYAGFDKDAIFKACCGGCGSLVAIVCSDPSKRINWDGPHFTEAAYKLIAKGLVEGPFSNPSLKSPLFKIA